MLVMGPSLMKVTQLSEEEGQKGMVRYVQMGVQVSSDGQSRAAAFCSQRTQNKLLAMLLRGPGSSPSSKLTLAFAHPIPFSPGLLGGPPGRGGSRLHHLQLHPLPTSQKLLGETRHLQGPGAGGGLGGARGAAAAVGGAALPAGPAEGHVREGVARPARGRERGWGSSGSGDSACPDEHLASPLSPFGFAGGTR